MSAQTKPLYEFGPFCLDPKEYLLRRAGEPVPLTPKVFATLLALVESGGQLVEKDELMNRIWPDAIVEERGLTQNIFLLRKVLGEDGAQAKYIETVPKRGYRFVAVINQRPNGHMDVIVQRRIKAHIVAEETRSADEPTARLVSLQKAALKTNDPHASASRIQRRRVVTLCALIGLAVALGVALLRLSASSKPRGAATVQAVKSVAVLPFQPINADPNDEHLSLGMADALIMKLGSLRQIIVRPTSAVRKYSNLDQDPLAIGRELQVDSVLHGSVERDGDRMRVRVQLVSVADGRQLWTANLDEKFVDLFAVQDSISEHVTQALAMQLTGDERRLLAKRYTDNTEAYQAYVKGRFFWNKRNGDGLKKAMACFAQAIEKDPNYALAYTGLADCYSVLSNYTPTSAKEAFTKAKAMASQALALDDTLAEAHTSLAYARIKLDWDWPAAEAEFKRAIELNPYQATAHHWYSEYLAAQGRLDEAVAEARRAQEIDPTALIIVANIGWINYLARRYDDALAACQRAIEMDRSFIPPYIFRAMAYEQKQMYEAAIGEYKTAALASGHEPDLLLWHAYALSGNATKARRALIAIEKGQKPNYISPVTLSLVYASVGETDRAFALLEEGFAEQDDGLTYLKVDPLWDSLRSDARFADLLRRVGLPP